MLLGKNLGGRHHGDLPIGGNGAQGGERGHDGLAAADIALQQALHRVRTREVFADLGEHPLLCQSERKGQVGEQARSQGIGTRQGQRAGGGAALPVQAHRQLLRQQFVELDALPRRVRAGLQCPERNVGRRIVQQPNTGVEPCQAQAPDHGGRQGLRKLGGAEGDPDAGTQRDLRETCRSRIDRRQTIGQRGAGEHGPDPRVDHLGTEEALPDLAHQPHPGTGRELLLLARIEVEQAHGQFAAVVAHSRDQLPPRSKLDVEIEHHAFDLCECPVRRFGDRDDAGLVLVAQWQMQDQIERAREAELRQVARSCPGDPGKRLGGSDGAVGFGYHAAFQRGTRITSTSTCAALGSAVTCTVVRAGNGCEKYSGMIALSFGKSSRLVR